MKKRKIKTSVKIILAFIITAIFVYLSVFLTFYFKDTKEYVKSTMAYNQKGSVIPSVCIKDNDFINSECYQDDRSYISSLIDKVKLKLNYKLETSRMSDFSYSYKVVAKTVANEKSDKDKLVYTNEMLLFERKNFEKENLNSLVIDDDVEFNYSDFNKVIIDFKKNYVISLDSKIEIYFIVSVDVYNKDIDKVKKIENKLSLNIPLAEQTVFVDKTNSEINKSGIVKNVAVKKNNKAIKNSKYVFYGLDIIMMFYIIHLFVVMGREAKMYDKRIKKILREYDRIIVNTKNEPDLNDLKIIDIDNFDELLDARDNLEKPIIFFENKRYRFSEFIILSDKEAYVYTLRAKDCN